MLSQGYRALLSRLKLESRLLAGNEHQSHNASSELLVDCIFNETLTDRLRVKISLLFHAHIT